MNQNLNYILMDFSGHMLNEVEEGDWMRQPAVQIKNSIK
jgi:hypothetical protein